MILTSIVSLITSVLINTLLIFAGKLLINNRRFLLYLGIKACEETFEEIKPATTDGKQSPNIRPVLTPSLASYIKNDISIEGILITIGLLVQWIAVFSILTELAVTILAIMRIVDASAQS
jgi:hypothetical protein